MDRYYLFVRLKLVKKKSFYYVSDEIEIVARSYNIQVHEDFLYTFNFVEIDWKKFVFHPCLVAWLQMDCE